MRFFGFFNLLSRPFRWRAKSCTEPRVEATRLLRVLVVTPFEDNGWRWLERHFLDSPYQWTYVNLDLFGKRQHYWLLAALRTTRLIKGHDLVISHTPYMTLYFALAMRLTRRRRPHLAFSFNHGNRRFFRGPLLVAAKALFPDVSLFVVYSQAEKDLLGKMYSIPQSKLSFQHWAVHPPTVRAAPPEYAEELGAYVCCIGRNNRDFETFLKAMSGLPLRAVLVCTGGRLAGLSIPRNVVVKTDLSAEECLRILAGAVASVVPLQDASTGAGHMTIVSAMQLGRPQVITRVDVIRDYVRDGENALLVETRSVGSLRAALLRLIEEPDLARRLGANAKEFADQWLSEEAAARHLGFILDAFAAGRPLPLSPPGWANVAPDEGVRQPSLANEIGSS